MIQNDLCTFCQASQETIKQLFFQCVHSKKFWNDFENYWLSITKKQRKLDYKSIIIGVLDEKSDLLNYLIILCKLYLWNCRNNSCAPVFSPFEVMVQSKYNTEKLIAANRARGAPLLRKYVRTTVHPLDISQSEKWHSRCGQPAFFGGKTKKKTSRRQQEKKLTSF